MLDNLALSLKLQKQINLEHILNKKEQSDKLKDVIEKEMKL
mgnify:CR=1 FL=1